jgi:diguanylate cyclase (GGDEF)-like protein
MTFHHEPIKQVSVKELMTTDVRTVCSSATLLEACQIMCDTQRSCLVVTDNDCPVGIITERDMVRILLSFLDTKSNKKLQLNSFMTTSPVTIQESQAVVDAMTLIQSKKIRHLPVVDQKGKLSGILAYSNIVQKEQQILCNLEESFNTQTHDLQIVNDQLRILSLEDPLLGIGNRRAMQIDLDYTHDVALRYDRPYSLVLIDVDYFKKYNDHYGHARGDDALKWISDYIGQTLRTADRVYRYGGEEFLLLLPETSEDGATIFVRRLVCGLAELSLPHALSPFGYLSISAGLVTEEPNQSKNVSWQQLVERADRALYTAKQQGRNQFAVSEKENTIYADTSAVA